MNASVTHDKLAPEIAEAIRQNRAVVEEAARIAGMLSYAQFNWQPGSGRWSVGDCIAHLNVVTRMYLPQFEESIQQARAAGRTGAGPYRYGWLTSKFVAEMEPPVKRRVKVPDARMVIAPGSDHDPAAVMEEFDTLHDRLIATIASADGLDLKKAKVTSVVTRFLRMSLGQWFNFNAAHDRRHLWQAQQACNDPAFPKT